MNDKYFNNKKFESDIEYRRKNSDSILREVAAIMDKTKLHSALVIWVSPFGHLEHRVGFFPDYWDCEEYAKFLDNSYKNSGMTYEVYINLGSL